MEYKVYRGRSGYKPGFLIADCFAIVIAIIAVRSPYTGFGAVLALAALAALFIWLVISIWRDRGKKELLIQVDEQGILDCNPAFSQNKYVAWKDVERVGLWGSESTRSIELVLKDGKKVYIALALSNVRPELILQKIQECRAAGNRG